MLFTSATVDAVTHVDEVRASSGAKGKQVDLIAGIRLGNNRGTLEPFPIQRIGHLRLPILPPEPDCFPSNLLDCEDAVGQSWWMLYTKSRQEKRLMRHLRRLEIAHYGPQIPKRQRSPSGRIRTSYVPLFNNYVFLCGDDESRYEAVCTGSVQKVTEITAPTEFLYDLRQIRSLIEMGVPLTIESRLAPGQQVRVRSGAFAGYEGTVLRREQETRLLVAVRFMEQGVSVRLEDCQLEPISAPPK